MKKIAILLAVIIMSFVLVSCGNNGSPEEKTPPKPLDLSGTWTQTNSNSEDSWHEAVIKDDTIEINWVSDNGDTKSLYWAGSYAPPEKSTDEYSWASENDKSKTDNALLASSDETKDFDYKDGVISYEASAMGTTMTIKLEKK